MGFNVDLCEVSKCYIMKASGKCKSNTPFNIKAVKNDWGNTPDNHWIIKLVGLKPFGCFIEAGDMKQAHCKF
jgi:hypothetical protein